MKKQRELGAGMIEYVLLVALLATVGFASIEKFGEAVSLSYCLAGEAITVAGVSGGVQAGGTDGAGCADNDLTPP